MGTRENIENSNSLYDKCSKEEIGKQIKDKLIEDNKSVVMKKVNL